MSGFITTLVIQSSMVMAGIKNYIPIKGLHPGDTLPTESQLYTDLGVPRSFMCKAARTLAALDIVEARHGHEMSVGQVSVCPMVESPIFKGLLNPKDDHRRLRDTAEVHITPGNALAEPATRAWYNRYDPELNALVDNIEYLTSQGKLFTDQDRCLHTRLLQPLDNHLRLHLAEAFWATHTLAVPLLNIPKLEDLTNTTKAHRATLQAAHAGDIPTYRKAITDHYIPLLAVLI